MKRSWRVLPALLAIILLATTSGQAAPARSVAARLHDDLVVERADGAGVELVLRPAWRLVPDGQGGHLAAAAHCDDPDRPRRQLRLALPPGARPEVTVAHIGTRACAGPLLGAGLAGPNPEPAVAWREEAWGDLRTLVVTVELVRDGGATAVLVEELRLRVDFAGDGRGLPTRLSRRDLAEGLLNPEAAAEWARPETPLRVAGAWDGTTWIRIPVTEEALYQITPAQLGQLGLSPQDLDPAAMKLYGWGGRMIDENPTAPRNNEFSPREIPLLREHDGDGAFETGERLVFHGRGTSGLVPGAAGEIVVQDHFYSDTNIYWLLVGGVQPGREMEPIADDSGAEPFPLPSVRWRGLVNEHANYGETSARACFGDILRLGTRAVYTMPAPLAGTTALRVQMDLYPDVSMPLDSLRLEANGLRVPGRILVNTTQVEGTLPLGGDQLSLTLERLSDKGLPILLNWLMPSFDAPARFVDGQVSFELPAVAGVYQVALAEAPASFYLVDATDFDSLRVTRGAVVVDRVKPLSGGTAGRSRRYFGAAENRLRSPAGMALAQMPDLKAQAGGARLIVIAPADLAEAAQEIVDVRRAAGVTARLALLEEVYAEFNAGVPDPGAVRNFLRHEWLSDDDTLKYVLLVGNGHYDYRGLVAGGLPARMPAWYLYSTSTEDADAMIDDWFVQLSGGNRLEFSLGRLPANSAAEVSAYARKLADYTSAAAPGPWRNRLLFVGDDEHGDGGVVNAFEISHSQNSEELIREAVPSAFDLERLYLFEYPSVYNASIRVNEKPLAEARLLAALNEGVALVNFLGHGNNQTWTHEYVFNSPRHFPLIQANGRPAVYIAATCSWAEVDLPVGEAFPQQLIGMEGGGAIGVLAATRKTGGFSNPEFVGDLFDFLFSREGAGYLPLGEAVRRAKNADYDSNRRKYVWLGDPSLPPCFPAGEGRVLDMTSDGQPADTLLSHALAGVRVATAAVDADSVRQGTARATLREAPVARRHDYDPYTGDPGYHGTHLDYESPGALLFSGAVDLAEGLAEVRFIVPADISGNGRAGELRVYYQGATVQGDASDGLVHARPPLAVNPNPGEDGRAPTLRLVLNGPQWRPDDWVAPNSQVILTVSDSSGVNLTGEIGHRVEVEIDGGTPQDLTGTFEYDRGSWTTGTARLPLPLLDPGEHRLRARAFDNHNNPGYAETTFRVLAAGTPRLADPVNFPNPVATATRFTFQLEGIDLESLPDCELQVFTVKGRRVARERLALAGEGGFLWTEEWRPRNDQGETLARGVYLYRLGLRLPRAVYSMVDGDGQYVVRSQEARTVETTGKLIVE